MPRLSTRKRQYTRNVCQYHPVSKCTRIANTMADTIVANATKIGLLQKLDCLLPVIFQCLVMVTAFIMQ